MTAPKTPSSPPFEGQARRERVHGCETVVLPNGWVEVRLTIEDRDANGNVVDRASTVVATFVDQEAANSYVAWREGRKENAS